MEIVTRQVRRIRQVCPYYPLHGGLYGIHCLTRLVCLVLGVKRTFGVKNND